MIDISIYLEIILCTEKKNTKFFALNSVVTE